MMARLMQFDHTEARRYVTETLGMIWDEPFAERLDLVLFHQMLNQEDFDVLVREYAFRVKTLFDPASYGFWARMLLAARFALRITWLPKG